MTVEPRVQSVGAVLAIVMLGCSTRLGIVDGKLLPCRAARNCVSTQGSDSSPAIEPFLYANRDEARERLLTIIRSLPRANVLTNTPYYLHAEFPTPIVSVFGCADDLEIQFDDRTKRAYLRSASRIRPFDFGSNKDRVEEIRKRFLAGKFAPGS